MLPRLAYLTLCRSMQLLALLARGDAAKELEFLVLRHRPSSTASPRIPGWNLPTEPCSPRSAVSCPLTGPVSP